LNSFTKNPHKVTAHPFVQNKGLAIINTNQQLSTPKEGIDLMKGELSIKLVTLGRGS